jgi:hypothetical protein
VPSEFRELLFEKRELLNAVFHAASETLLSYCAEQGFVPAITGVLHTFGNDLKRHVHIHFIISAGGLKLSGKQARYVRQKNGRTKKKKLKVLSTWVKCTFFPYKMLHKRYQALLIKHLKAMINKNLKSNNPDPGLKPFSDPKVMESFFDELKQIYSNGFFVWVSEQRFDLKATVAYIARYARRPPISEVRIKDYDGEWVTFEYTDPKAPNSPVTWKLKATEFIKKLIRHISPHYFNVIRHYGIIASRVKTKFKEITDKLLGIASKIQKFINWRQRQTKFRGKDPMLCKICNSTMVFVKNQVQRPLAVTKEYFKTTFT